MDESAVQNLTRRDFAFIGPVWRNNSGMLLNKFGVPVRYGLANESEKENEKIKSSDLIAVTPVQCFVQSIGWTTLGVFTALECKPSGWHMTPSDKRAIAQSRFHDIVREAGGFAGFVTDPGDIHGIIRRG